jgi:hypothetical protein
MSMMLKMAIVIITIFIYVSNSGDTFNKRSVFVSLFLYLAYLATEVYVVMKMNKRKNV